jgi:hypothetical protein
MDMAIIDDSGKGSVLPPADDSIGLTLPLERSEKLGIWGSAA